MTFAEKLTELRKSRGWSQEDLGERLGVTRQTVSKWELGATTPEMEKLAAMSELFGVSVDELIRGGNIFGEPKPEPFSNISNTERKRFFVNGEYKSKKTLCGMPLVHITSRGAAKGFIAIGIRARGIVSIGLLSVGVLSIGLLALGVIAWGMLALGVFSSGMVAAGVFALGGISVGIFSFGGASLGWLSYGGASIGKYAYGGYASGDIAIGGYVKGIVTLGKNGGGDIFFNTNVSAEEFRAAVMSKLPNTPKFITDIFSWLAETVSFN